MKDINIYDFFDLSNGFSVIQFNIFNSFIKSFLLPVIDNMLEVDYKLNDFYVFNINIKPFLKDIIILLIIFFIFNLFKPIKY